MLPRRTVIAASVAFIALLASSCRFDQVTLTIDGDTIRTPAGDIRLQGIDTPEKGENCFNEAKFITAALINQSGGNVQVFSSGTNDKYGREIAFVHAGGQDIGEVLLRFGVATARYDSRDGYKSHSRETKYHNIDNKTATTKCPVPGSSNSGASSSGGSGSSGGASYYANCTAVRNAGKAPLYRGDLGYRSGLDRDNDGIACEV